MDGPLSADFLHALGRVVSGGVRADLITRTLYATDASIYQIEPLGVAFPRDGDELAAAVETAARFQVPVLARGSGSSIAGQAIGPALILDCSRHLDHILEIDPAAGTALVEPGVILNSLNRAAARHGLQFGPDPASAERATLGGSLANNATGAHSILYGMAADHLLEADVILSDGSQANFRAVPLTQARRIAGLADGRPATVETAATANREALIYRAAFEIQDKYQDAIRERWPHTWRRASGYSLNYLLPYAHAGPALWQAWQPADGAGAPLPYPPVAPDTLNLAALLAGSEGTLGVIRRARLRLVALPRHTVLGVLRFSSLAAACDAAPALLAHSPSAVELIPASLIRLARSVPAYAAQLSFINALLIDGEIPAALLVVEFSGDDPAALRSQAAALAGPDVSAAEYSRDVLIADTPQSQRQVWGVRKVAMGLLSSRPGKLKSIAFIEDLTVPVERLGEFVREMGRILADHHTTGEFAGHASAGCLHIRPMLDLTDPAGRASLRRMAGQAVALTLRLGGAVSGEHGDGLARSEWLEQMYGPDLMQAFRTLKRAADPHNLLNPGKIVDAPPFDTHLRVETIPPGGPPHTWQPVMDFSRQVGIAGAVEMCNGAGVCRKVEGVMCPSFQATRAEMHSTRGRANLLRAMINAPANSPALPEISRAVFEALDLCLACKGCQAECPAGVDVARLKYEFMHAYYQHHPRKLRDYLFGYIGVLARLGSPFADLLNPLLNSRPFKIFLEKSLGISRQRALPRFARSALRPAVDGLAGPPPPGGWLEKALFLSDPFTEYYYPQNGLAAIAALQRAGIQPVILPVLGAGRTLLSKGFLPPARAHAARLLEAIYQLDPGGALPVVGVEPSEIYTLSDEFVDLLPGDGRAAALAQRAWMIDEFLLRPGPHGQPRLGRYEPCNPKASGRVYLHGHCYQKARPPHGDGCPTGVAATRALLEAAGYQVHLIDSGCCGMAGAFGYEVEHLQLSMQIGELALFPAIREAVRQANGDIIIAAAGVSCQAQIEDGVHRQPVHPIVLFERACL